MHNYILLFICKEIIFYFNNKPEITRIINLCLFIQSFFFKQNLIEETVVLSPRKQRKKVDRIGESQSF
jgi:hypothetical protein